MAGPYRLAYLCRWNATKTGYDMHRGDVADCLLLSEAAYLTRFEAADMASTIGATLLYAFHVGAVHCYCFRKEGTLYLATRGTDITSLLNVIFDARFIPKKDPDVGFIHRGFAAWADLLWEDVSYALQTLGPQADRVVFCGHSAGGAASNLLAVKAAPYLIGAGGQKPWVVTFGSPMVGTYFFTRRLAKSVNHIRVTNNNDPVPHVPLWPLYIHAKATRYHICADGEVVKNPTMFDLMKDVPRGIVGFTIAFLKEVVRQKSVLLAVVNSLKMGDHFIKNYKGYF